MLLPFGSIFFNTLSPKLHRFHMNVLFADNAEALNSATVSFRIHAAPFVIAGRVMVVASALNSGASKPSLRKQLMCEAELGRK